MKPTYRPTSCVALPFAAACALLMPVIARGHGGVAHPGLDANENHVSDVYEALYPAAADAAADSDGDGVTNEAESVAATNPLDTHSFLHLSAISAANGTVTATWQSVRGKSYRLQAPGKGGASGVNAGDALPGTGGALSASFPIEESRKMLRVQVSDIDTDADGVTDWEELQAGTDPYLWDTDGDGRSDRGFVESRFGVVNTVDVAAVSTWASETGPRAAQFRLTRRGGFLPMTVQFTTGGTAVMGADYALSATSATFAAGAREALVTMTPLADAQMEEAETVILSLAAGSNYQIGSASSATITIISQGLTGQYFDTANGTYSNSLNFDPAQLKLTRRDAAVDFDWSPGTPHPSIVDDDVWSVRWSSGR